MFIIGVAFAMVMAGQVMAQDAETVILNDLLDGITEAYESAEGKDGPYKSFKYSDVKENVVDDHGSRCVRTIPDETIDNPDMMQNRRNCFIIMSKKDYYLYVYEIQDKDTVMLARYDCCFGQHVGNKQMRGDKKTPSSCNSDKENPFAKPFTISQIQNASTWKHDFKDGRGNIKSYGDWFLRLVTPGHSGIGIHGSTNNELSVPGRASEGCIRLKDADIIKLRNHYAFEGMKVIIKDEKVDDLPFEIKAMRQQKIERKRHFDPSKTVKN
ncbi:MAG: L,D-transpeptidase [Prevotella sp.]|nr:L,D-transpeptidase [Prevotella sp.]